MDFTRCPGCTHRPLNNLLARIQEGRNLEAPTRLRIRDLQALIDTATNWEDVGRIQEEIEERSKCLSVLSLFQSVVDTNMKKYPVRYWDDINTYRASLAGADDYLHWRDRVCNMEIMKWSNVKLTAFETDLQLQSTTIAHCFDVRDHHALAAHWDLLQSGNDLGRVLLVVDDLHPAHAVCLSLLFGLDTSVFVQHLWRLFCENSPEYGLAFLQNAAADLESTELNVSHAFETQPDRVTKTGNSDSNRAMQTCQSTAEQLMDVFYLGPSCKRASDFDFNKIKKAADAEFRNPRYSRPLSSPLFSGHEWPWNNGLCETHPAFEVRAEYLVRTSFYSFRMSAQPHVAFGLILEGPLPSYPVRIVVPDKFGSSVVSRHEDPSRYILPALAMCREHEVRHSGCSLPWEHRMVIVKLFWIHAIFKRTHSTLQTDLRSLARRFPEDKALLQTVASRSASKRALTTRLENDIQEMRAGTLRTLPGELRLEVEKVIFESLKATQVLTSTLDALDHAIKEMRDEQFRNLQIELTQTQIKESRAAIKQAGVVARLTMLAFVYIPTACVCGIFGMNIIETPDGFPLWVFGVTLTGVLTTTLLLAFASPISALLTQMWSLLSASLMVPYNLKSRGPLERMARLSTVRIWRAVMISKAVLRNGYFRLKVPIRKGRVLDAAAEEALERGIQARLDKKKTEIEHAVEMQTMFYDEGTSLFRF